MPLNLVPEETHRGRGCHGEQLDTALLDAGLATILDVILAIDNGKEEDETTIKGWLQGKITRGETVVAEDIAKSFDLIVLKLSSVHAKLIAARQKD